MSGARKRPDPTFAASPSDAARLAQLPMPGQPPEAPDSRTRRGIVKRAGGRETARFVIFLTPDLGDWVRRTAFERGLELSELVQNALESRRTQGVTVPPALVERLRALAERSDMDEASALGEAVEQWVERAERSLERKAQRQR